MDGKARPRNSGTPSLATFMHTHGTTTSFEAESGHDQNITWDHTASHSGLPVLPSNDQQETRLSHRAGSHREGTCPKCGGSLGLPQLPARF